MQIRTLFFYLVTATGAWAQAGPFDLGNYRLTRTFDLPRPAAAEASAIAYNRDTGTLFVMGDEGDYIVELTRAGTPVSAMYLRGFDDTEGLTYIGGGRFVIAEERLQRLYLLTYVPSATVDRSGLQSVALGPTVDNIGIEGVSFEPRTGLYFAVKEKEPQRVLRVSGVEFGTGAATVDDAFNPAVLGLLDLSDVQVLSTVPSLIGTPDQDNLLIYSQESARLLEIGRDGTVHSAFNFGAISTSAEGVTIDEQGRIYLCDETPRVYVLEPRPTATFATPRRHPR